MVYERLMSAGRDREPTSLELAAADFEWDFLFPGREITTITAASCLPAQSTNIRVERDSQYDIIVEVRGSRGLGSGDIGREYFGEHVPGAVVEGERIEGTDAVGGRYRLTGVLPVSLERQYDLARSVEHFTCRMTSVGSISVELEDVEPGILCEWYLNGPSDTLSFYRTTRRSFDKCYDRHRTAAADSGLRPEADRTLRPQESHRHDYVLVTVGNHTAAVGLVPEKCAPKWSRCLQFEYRSSWGGIPPSDVRAALAEIVSFVFGRQLLLVGETSFHTGRVVRVVSCSPWGNGIPELCRRASFPPVRLHDESGFSARAEQLLGSLVPNYMRLRQELALDEALWQFWIAERSPLGPNILLATAAIERLIAAWHGSKRSSTTGLYMTKERFDGLVAPEMATLQCKLTGESRGKEILRVLENAYRMSGGDRVKAFFTDIGLAIGKREQAALDVRHRPAHGNVLKRPEDIQHWNTTQTLFHRTVLKVLGYTDKYVDYATLSLPERKIDEPVP